MDYLIQMASLDEDERVRKEQSQKMINDDFIDSNRKIMDKMR